MKILLLSPYPERLGLKSGWDAIVSSNIEWENKYLREFDFVVSYGYRHIFRDTASLPPIVNLHTSFLPWNRGADPNYWAHRDGTPHGVTIHKIDDGIDTGPIYAQRKVVFRGNTLRETYEELHEHICDLFTGIWPLIRNGVLHPSPQVGEGSFHRTKDRPENIDYDAPIVTDLDSLHGCGYVPRRNQHGYL